MSRRFTKVTSRSAELIRSSRQELLSLTVRNDFGVGPRDRQRAMEIIQRIVALCAAGGHDCSPEIRALRVLQGLEPLASTGGGSIPPGVRRLAGNAGLLDAEE